jgi:DNA-binding IclR family transcriptional regulator
MERGIIHPLPLTILRRNPVLKKAKSDYLIQSVSRALDILEAFTVKEGALGVTELSCKLRLHKNNVFRLLATLETRGYVEQDKERGTYRLGIKLYEVASVFLHHLDIRRQARPVLPSVARELNETVYLAVRQGASVVYVEGAETEEPIRVVTRLGARLPAHATAAGKAISAFLSREKFDELFSQTLVALTNKTITDREALFSRLVRVADDGYAVGDEEETAGVRSVAAPVWDLTKQVAGAVECVAPAFRMGDERIQTIVPQLLAAAREISVRLGAA